MEDIGSLLVRNRKFPVSIRHAATYWKLNYAGLHCLTPRYREHSKFPEPALKQAGALLNVSCSLIKVLS